MVTINVGGPYGYGSTPVAPDPNNTTGKAGQPYSPNTTQNPATTSALTGVPWAPDSTQQNTQIGVGPVITQGQQAAAFSNPNSALEQSQINGMPVNSTAFQIGASPLAGLTTLGNGTINGLTAGQFANINDLNAQAHGQGPSVAEMQAKQQGQQNAANAAGLVASQRGASNPALGLRAALGAETSANQQAVQAGVQGRTAEEMNAENALTGALGTAQGQQMQFNTAQGQMNQQVRLANQQSQMQTLLANLQAKQQTQGLNVNEYNAMVQAESALTNTNMTAAENYANLVTGENTSRYGIDQGVAINSANNLMGLGAAGIGAVGAGGAAYVSTLNNNSNNQPQTPQYSTSDRNLKFAVKSAGRSVKDFMSQIKLPPPKFALMGA